ncbi:MAG: efflux RND transporter periplasmic adaptor subunit, partial [Gammaproteobacteria bacterium]
AVPTAAPRRALVVPRDALVLRRNGIAVYRLTADGGAERVAVRTGIAQGAFIEVLGELSPGDRVITRGGERLRPGQKVRVLNEAEG